MFDMIEEPPSHPVGMSVRMVIVAKKLTHTTIMIIMYTDWKRRHSTAKPHFWNHCKMPTCHDMQPRQPASFFDKLDAHGQLSTSHLKPAKIDRGTHIECFQVQKLHPKKTTSQQNHHVTCQDFTLPIFFSGPKKSLHDGMIRPLE